MSDFNRQRIQRAKQYYRCDECQRSVLPGDVHVYGFARVDGVIYYARYHLDCYGKSFDETRYPCPGIEKARAEAQT